MSDEKVSNVNCQKKKGCKCLSCNTIVLDWKVHVEIYWDMLETLLRFTELYCTQQIYIKSQRLIIFQKLDIALCQITEPFWCIKLPVEQSSLTRKYTTKWTERENMDIFKLNALDNNIPQRENRAKHTIWTFFHRKKMFIWNDYKS